MILSSAKLIFWLLETSKLISFEILIQTNDLRSTQLLGTLYDCSKQVHVKQFSWTPAVDRKPVLSENENITLFAFVFVRPKAKKTISFRCSATVQKIRALCAQGAHTKWV